MRPRLGAAVPASATPGRIRLPRRRAASCATNSLPPANSGSQPVAKRCHRLHYATPTQDAAIPVRDEGARTADSGASTAHLQTTAGRCAQRLGRDHRASTIRGREMRLRGGQSRRKRHRVDGPAPASRIGDMKRDFGPRDAAVCDTDSATAAARHRVGARTTVAKRPTPQIATPIQPHPRVGGVKHRLGPRDAAVCDTDSATAAAQYRVGGVKRRLGPRDAAVCDTDSATAAPQYRVGARTTVAKRPTPQIATPNPVIRRAAATGRSATAPHAHSVRAAAGSGGWRLRGPRVRSSRDGRTAHRAPSR